MEFDLPTVPQADPELAGNLELGAFSTSLNVADLETSRAFYEKLGFVVSGGDPAHNYLILKNAETTIGIFEGMFEGNILTFNPGLTNRMERIESFLDVRQVEAHLEESGVGLEAHIEPDNPPGPPRSPWTTATRF